MRKKVRQVVCERKIESQEDRKTSREKKEREKEEDPRKGGTENKRRE